MNYWLIIYTYQLPSCVIYFFLLFSLRPDSTTDINCFNYRSVTDQPKMHIKNNLYTLSTCVLSQRLKKRNHERYFLFMLIEDIKSYNYISNILNLCT